MIRTILILIILVLATGCGVNLPDAAKRADDKAVIYPDYSSVTFPSNISPISFRVEIVGDDYMVEIVADGESLFSDRSDDGTFSIPERVWRKVTSRDSFDINIYINIDGEWHSYQPIKNYICSSTIDSYLTYRLIAPGYELWNDMGIYQRDLTSFDQEAIITNSQTGGGCVNCHTYGSNSVENSMFHYRSANGGTIIRQGDDIKKVRFNRSNNLISEGTYPAWHPSNNFIAYSVNDISQYFHIKGSGVVEVSDSKSDIILYDIKNDRVVTDSLLFETDMLETFPEWSRDGKQLFYTATQLGSHSSPLDSIRYSLYSVDFDEASQTFSNRKLLIDADSINGSISFAKVSYDGGYIVATLADYGNFTIWHSEADIIVYDISTGKWRRADEINSDNTESYHSFSSSGDWMVFSSRRDDGLYTRPYFTKFDPQKGEFTKPFMLPQQSADFYDNLFYSYNIPNFTHDKYRGRRKLLEVVNAL